jgi:hypothetical protein
MIRPFRSAKFVSALSVFMCLSSTSLVNADENAAANRRDPPGRDAAERSPGFKNLVSIALAFHEYHDIYGHFPAAVVIGPDGKTPHSWHVELLPLVRDHGGEFRKRARRDEPFGGSGNRKLYASLIEKYGYKLDQPWDSVHNRQVLARSPDVFRYPQDANDSHRPER